MRSGNWKSIGVLCGVLTLCCTETAAAQIVVGGPAASYNTLGSAIPSSTDMSNTGDLFVSNDIEVGGELYLSRVVYVAGELTSPPDGDQIFYFADNGDALNEFFRFDDSEDSFGFSNDIVVDESVDIEAQDEGQVRLFSQGTIMRFVVDSDDDNALTASHLFIWGNDSTSDGDRAMQLQSNNADTGDLFVDGQLGENTSFDLAENFWQSSPVEPGDLVSVDPNRPDAVVLTHGAADRAVLGVVSTRPGVLLGAFAFSIERLRDAWGDEVARDFEAMRPEMEAEVLASRPSLVERRELLSSPASFASAYLAEWQAPEMPSGGDGPFRVAPTPSEEDLLEEYEIAREALDLELSDAIMARFFDQHFAPVALAGRVPVRVDATFGAVEPGDLLAPSPVPGAAMKATRPGPTIGVALEPLPGGEDKILVLVQRGWYGGDALATAARGFGDSAALADLRAENQRLESRLLRLEQSLSRLTGSGGTSLASGTDRSK